MTNRLPAWSLFAALIAMAGLFAIPPPTAPLFWFALAALTILPTLDAAGFQPGAANPEPVLQTLTLIYAGLPCVLKAIASHFSPGRLST